MATEYGKIMISQKSGEETLMFEGQNTGYRLIEFWQWSASDIISNATRGMFAEFIVASSLDIDLSNIRDEWSGYDLTSPEGIKIEVKSSSYLQSWYQKDLSKISFSIKPAKQLDLLTNKLSSTPSRPADIYVFCLLKHKEQSTLNPMNLEQWEFYVLPKLTIENYKRSKSSITLKSLQNLTGPKTYIQLKQTIIDQYKSCIPARKS